METKVLKFPNFKPEQQKIALPTPKQMKTTKYPKMSPRILKPRVLRFVSNQHLSYICMIICPCFWIFGIMYGCERNISSIEINFARYLSQLLFQLALCMWKKEKIIYRNKTEFRNMILRGLITCFHGFIHTLFLFYLPMVIVNTTSASGSIFIFIINYQFYGQKISRGQAIAAAVGLFGVVLAVLGRFIYSLIDPNYVFTSKFPFYRSESDLELVIISMCLIIWMVVWGYGILLTTKTSSEVNHVILLYSIVGFYMFGLGYMSIQNKNRQNLETFIKLVCISGVSLTISNFCFNWGLFISESIGHTSIVNQMTVILSYFICYFRYDQQINYISLVGNVMAFVGCYVILIKK